MTPGRRGSVVEALSQPGIYPGRPESVDVRETPISWVFLAGERAYKLEKDLVLPFLDLIETTTDLLAALGRR